MAPRKPPAAHAHEPPTAESVQQLAVSTMEAAVRAIQTEIENVASGKAAKSKHDPASRIAWLGQRAAAIGEAARKMVAGQRRSRGMITRGEVLGWLREQEPTVRAAVAREIAAIVDEGSVLR